MTTSATRRATRDWLRRYGAATFYRSWDARLAVITLLAAMPALSLSEGARAASGDAMTATLGVCAGLLGVVLGAMAIVTAFVTRSFVALVGDMRDALMPFGTIAVVAACGLLCSLGALLLVGPAMWWVTVGVVSVALSLTTWTVVGTVQLVHLVIYFATVRSREIATLVEAERIRTSRLQAR